MLLSVSLTLLEGLVVTLELFALTLLFALPLLEGESIIRLTSPLESRGYVDMTLQVLRDRGIRVEELPEGFRVPGGQQYGRGTLGEEADYSQAAFWLAAAGLGSPLTVEGLDPDSTQGDRCVVPYFQQLAGPGRVELDIAQCPDLAPALAVRAALRPGQTARLVNAGRLRLKECDRLAAIPEELNKLGGQLTEGADFLEIRGVERLGMPLVETDALVVEKTGRSIPDIFAQDGEAAFRREETAAARRAAAMEGTVISTGGGIILRPENMEILSATGTVYFLDRDPRDIANTELDGRPLLSGGRDRVFLLYDQRINLYRKYARYTVPSTTVDETVDSVLALVRRGQDVR